MRTALVVAIFALAWPAVAQATDYGGGTAPESPTRSSRQLTLVGIRTAADGSARVTVLVSAPCGVGKVLHSVQLNPDGTFAFDVTVRSRVPDDRRVRQRARIVMSGQVAGAAASGTAGTRLVHRRGGRVVGRCRSGSRTWQARAAAAEPTAAAPRADGSYHGLTAQSRRPFPFVLRVDPRGRRVRTAVFDYRQRCRRGGFEWENVTPGGPIAADGSFRLRERFTYRWAEGRERYHVRVDGQFTPNGVSGTLSVRSVLRSPSGRVLDRCRTGRQSFAALL
jgi:hypothetical protein